jgi:hypothetical protein
VQLANEVDDAYMQGNHPFVLGGLTHAAEEKVLSTYAASLSKDGATGTNAAARSNEKWTT